MFDTLRLRGRRGWTLPAAVAAVALAAILVGGCGQGSRRAPVVVIGLDGADFDLITPWIQAGELPHLAQFFDGAALGKMTVVYPILSPVCWTSAVTGVNPGKHGIYGFQKEDPGGGEPILELATHRRALPIWMLLSDAGYRVAVLNVPMTYPPDPVRGVMVSGFPFPDSTVNPCYPPELQSELGDYPLDYLGLTLFGRTQETMKEEIFSHEQVRRRVALDWVRSGKYDFTWLVFTGTDKVQHFYWKDMDPHHPLHTPEGEARFGKTILEMWKFEDQVVGEILAELPKDATVVLLSDHGFDALYRQVNLGNWFPRSELPQWLKTYAFPPVSMTNGLILHKIQSELPGSSDREVFVDRLIGLMESLRDPKNGKAPIESMFKREQIYSGRMLDKAPDIVFQETPKYYVTRGNPDSLALPVFQDIWSTSFSAHHRPQGILAIRAPGVKAKTTGSLAERLAAGGDFHDAKILDVTPTLLALMGEIIPDQVDGRVLDEVIDPARLRAHPITVAQVEGFLLDRLPETPLSPEEREKLQAIPYIQ